VVKAGQIVQVTVLAVDPELKRISLSMKKEPGQGGQKSQGKADGEVKRIAPQGKPSPVVRSVAKENQPKLSDVDRLKQWASGSMNSNQKKK
jgi:transcriptional accessory protein Tex/SPT6